MRMNDYPPSYFPSSNVQLNVFRVDSACLHPNPNGWREKDISKVDNWESCTTHSIYVLYGDVMCLFIFGSWCQCHSLLLLSLGSFDQLPLS